MKTGICVTLIASLFIDLSEAATKFPSTDSSIEIISSLEQADALVRATQEQFWQLFPPSDDWLYVHSDKSVKPVIWSSGWPNALKKQMSAEMRSVNGNLYPVYTLWAEADRITGDLTYYNMFGQPVWISPAPLGYTPLSSVLDRYGVESVEDLSGSQQKFTASSVGLEFQFIPEVFMDSYVEDSAMEVRAALLAAPVVMPLKGDETVSVGIALVSPETTALALPEEDGVMMAMASALPPPPGGGGGTNSVPGSSTSNLLVELTISIPAGFGHMGHIETFAKDNLILPGWSLADDWIPTYGRETVYWIDPVSSNKMQRFYLVSNGADMDGDFHSDLYEAWVGGTDSNAFNSVNVDGDDFHDWLEIKMFGDLSQAGTNDFDSDGLLNNEELIVVSVDQPAIMISNPALADSDGDGLNDYQERRVWNTDAMDPDTDNDGREDDAEVLGSPATDPNNSDTVSPTVVFAGN